MLGTPLLASAWALTTLLRSAEPWELSTFLRRICWRAPRSPGGPGVPRCDATPARRTERIRKTSIGLQDRCWWS